jgi:hypothetical protein
MWTGGKLLAVKDDSAVKLKGLHPLEDGWQVVQRLDGVRRVDLAGGGDVEGFDRVL